MVRPAARSALLLLVFLLCVACGGGGRSSGGGGLDFGSYPVPGDPASPPGGTPPGGGGTAPPSLEDLQGGVLLTIQSSGETWRWWVTNPQTAQALKEVWDGTRGVISFGGVLRPTAGSADHNAPWSWHVDPQLNGVDGLTVPESPDRPSNCENQLAYWLSLGVVFLPSSSTIVAFEDRR